MFDNRKTFTFRTKLHSRVHDQEDRIAGFSTAATEPPGPPYSPRLGSLDLDLSIGPLHKNASEISFGKRARGKGYERIPRLLRRAKQSTRPERN